MAECFIEGFRQFSDWMWGTGQTRETGRKRKGPEMATFANNTVPPHCTALHIRVYKINVLFK